MSKPMTKAAADLHAYMSGHLLFDMEREDPRFDVILAAVDEKAAAIEAAAVNAVLDRLAAAHQPYPESIADDCRLCQSPWPCPSRRAIEKERRP